MLIVLLLISVFIIVWGTTKLKLHPFLALLIAALFFGVASGMPLELIITSVEEGFGNTLKSIGLVIILGVIIGAFLEKSGGAYALAGKLVKWIGEKRVPMGMSLIGYIVSIPVFADSGFIILSPLNKALTSRAGKSLAVTSVALALGLLASHAMVPPTPGPVAAAGILGADIGLVIFYGIFVSLFCLIPGLIFARTFASKVWLDPNPGISNKELEQRIKEAPAAWKAVLPIFVPILLIVLASFNKLSPFVEDTSFSDFLNFIGKPVIALIIALLLALLLPKQLEKHMFSTEGWVGKALKEAAIILMITGAGGIFGKVLQNSGFAEVITNNLSTVKIGIWLPFLISAALKSAQGSSTVAMITTASLLSPMLPEFGFETELSKAFCVLAIGAGSTVVSHANDSFFWVVTQLSGMSTSQGYRLHTIGTGIIGISAALAIYVLWVLLV